MEIHPLRYSLRQLRYFVVTAEALSFTAAARRLHISQPSISTALADLEESFGVQLFIRHHASGLSLTQAGRDLLGQARNLLKIAEELQARDTAESNRLLYVAMTRAKEHLVLSCSGSGKLPNWAAYLSSNWGLALDAPNNGPRNERIS